MKHFFTVLLFLVVTTGYGISATPEFKLVRLPSGKQIKCFALNTAFSPDHKTKALVFGYQTDKNISDTQALAQEADDIWDMLKNNAEQSGLKAAVISANTELGNFDRFNRVYNFTIVKNPQGQWYCTNNKIVTKGTPAKIAYRQAREFTAKGDCKKALVFYDKSICLNPNYAEAYVERGAICFMLHQSDKALRDLNKAISLNPDSAIAYTNRGAVYGEAKQYQKAIDDCSKSITLSNNPVGQSLAYANRGVFYVEAGEYEKGIDDLTKSITSNPKPAESYYYRSIAEDKLGKKDLAAVDRKKATDLGYREGENTTFIDQKKLRF